MKKGKFRLHKVLATSAMMIFLSGTVSFAGHKNYFIKANVDYGGFGIMTEVITDDPKGKNTGTGGVGDNSSPYAEEKGEYSYSKVMHYGNISTGGNPNDDKGGHLQISFLKDRSNATARAEQYDALKDGDKNKGLVFSFPGLKDKMNGGYRATSNDYMRASMVAETLTTGLNQALLFIKDNANDDMASNYSLQLALSKLSYTSENKRYEVTMGGTKFTIQPATGEKAQKELIPVNGLTTGDYVKITAENGPNGEVYSYFPWKMAKGYHSGQPLYQYVNKTYRDNVKANENEFLTWGQLILQAMLNADVHGKTEQDYASDVQTIIGQGLGSDLSRTISSVRNQLGLAPMSELVLNMGARPANYHMGVMNNSVRSISMTIYTLMLIISLTFLAFMIIKLIHQKMVSTTNVIAKTSLMEGIKDIAFVAVMLGFFAPLFEVLLELNYLIVRTFSYSNEYMTAFSILGGKALAMESMAGFIISTMFLSVDLYINFVYLVRELTVAFLYAIAPMIIVSYLWSPQQKQLVFGFFRELVGNIFMQSFHAITMTFFAGYNTTNLSNLQALASAYCFIPITQLFRQLMIGNSGGFSEKIGGKLAGQVANTSIGMQKAGMNYQHSKAMIEAQQSANVKSAIGSTVGSVGGSLASAGIGATVGTAIFPGVGTVGGALIGGAVGGIINGLSSGIGQMEGQKEIGRTQLKNSEQQVGMGLAELGVGFGISSFDGTGDRMIGSGLQSIQQGASERGMADARYNANSEKTLSIGGNEISIPLTGYGSATKMAGLATGIQAGGNTLAGAIDRKAIADELGRNGKPKNEIEGISGLKAEHVHSVKQISKGEMEMVTKLKMDDAKSIPDLNNAINAYRNRSQSDTARRQWEEMSMKTGINEISKNINDELVLRLNSSRSGLMGMKAVKEGDMKVNRFIVETEKIRDKDLNN